MKRYGNEMKRMLIAVIIIAAIIATGILLASYNIENPDDPGPPSTDHTPDLPIAPLAIIVQSGTDGTRVIADLEFGFRKIEIQLVNDLVTYQYLIGYKRDFLDVRNGFNKSGVIGLGYSEIREYSFAYVGNISLFEKWSVEAADEMFNVQPAWTADIAEGSHSGPIHQENLTEMTNAGVVLEIIDFSIYFEDGSNFVCGSDSLTVGVNFTRNGDEWNIDYIYESSNNESVFFAPALVSIQLSNPIPEHSEDAEPGQTTDKVDVPTILLTTPTVIAIVLILIIVIVTRKRK